MAFIAPAFFIAAFMALARIAFMAPAFIAFFIAAAMAVTGQ